MNYPALSDASLREVHAQIKAHRLPNDFIDTVTRYYWPLSQKIEQGRVPQQCHYVGIHGSQGSGKSTCAAFLKTVLQSEFKLNVLVASIDDFYLTLEARKALARDEHPLLLTRGVPGTHDINLIKQLFSDAAKPKEFAVPSFNKATDDRAPQSDWPKYTGPFDVVIFEGWCVGIPPQNSNALSTPVNDLERLEDSDQRWRKFVNHALSTDYQTLFSQLDSLISLNAPSFGCVYQWRALQEQKLIEKLEAAGRDTSATMQAAELKRFISHYQRLTEHAFNTLPQLADVVLQLNAEHKFTNITGVEQ